MSDDTQGSKPEHKAETATRRAPYSHLKVDKMHGGEREGEITATKGFSLPKTGTKHFWQKIAYVLAYCIYVPGSALFFRAVRVEKNIPRKGGAFLLANHTSVMDPAWTMFHSWRMDAHFMASSTLFAVPIIGPLIQALGAFPKAKQVKDRSAMALMSEIYDRGGIIMMFPEGERTWDGRTVPALPGIGRLLKRRRYKVITARILTGHFFQPRWAKYPRYVPIHVEYDKPMTFPEGMTAEEITQAVTERITVDMRGRKAPPLSFGFRMAHGLPGFLWACPSCFEIEGLGLSAKSGNMMVCKACGEEYKVDVSAWIHPQKGGAEGMPVYAAYDRITDTLTPERLGKTTDGQGRPIILEAPVCELNKILRKLEYELMFKGRARLVPGLLQILGESDDDVLWESAVEDLLAVNLDVGSQLFLRWENHLLRLDPGEESRPKWAHFIRLYHPKYRDIKPVHYGKDHG